MPMTLPWRVDEDSYNQREVYITCLVETLDRTMSVEEKRKLLGATFDSIDRMIEDKFIEMAAKYHVDKLKD